MVESKNLGRIIGAGGSILNKIQELTEARLDIPRRTQGVDGAPQARSTTARVPVSLTGSREAVKAAKAIIKDLCHKGYSALLAEEGDDFKEFEGKIPTSIVPEIVGTRGSIIMQIKDKCNVKINISENKQRDPLTRVTVAGPSAGVEKTRGKRTKMMESCQHSAVLFLGVWCD